MGSMSDALDKRFFLQGLTGFSCLCSFICAVELLRQTGKYLKNRLVATVVFNMALSGGIFALSELVLIFALWLETSDMNHPCKVARLVQYILLTVLVLLAVLICVTFICYACRFSIHAFRRIRRTTYFAWPVAFLAHAGDLFPAGSFDEDRGFCDQNYGTVGNTITAVLFALVIVTIWASLVIWLTGSRCFPRARYAPQQIYRRNNRRLAAIAVAVIPGFACLDYCALFNVDHCPSVIENTSEVLSVSFLWITFVTVRSLGVAQWNEIYERDIDFGAAGNLATVFTPNVADEESAADNSRADRTDSGFSLPQKREEESAPIS